MVIKAVVFDFDGTLMDTESCAFDAFCGVYEEYGQQLLLEQWALGIGTVGGQYDPYSELEKLVGEKLDREAVRARFEAVHHEQLKNVTLRPGVKERLEEARRLGLSIGLASSSERAWVERHLRGQGIRDYFEAVHTSDDVERVKPDPALYRLALESLGVKGSETVAVEDSVNGLRAAKAAGLYGLVVPNRVTAHMNFGEADLVVASLADQSFAELFARFDKDN
jgi:putative hydrolase of the HAD superfamily